jgi:hypothetical protein
MSQQEMGYGEMNRSRPETSYRSGYEEEPHHYQVPPRAKLSGNPSGAAATAGQRLALAIVSLAMLMVMVFGLIGIAIATNVPNWAIIPILFIIVLFSVVAVLINVVFNRRS